MWKSTLINHFYPLAVSQQPMKVLNETEGHLEGKASIKCKYIYVVWVTYKILTEFCTTEHLLLSWMAWWLIKCVNSPNVKFLEIWSVVSQLFPTAVFFQHLMKTIPIKNNATCFIRGVIAYIRHGRAVIFFPRYQISFICLCCWWFYDLFYLSSVYDSEKNVQMGQCFPRSKYICYI